MKKPGYVYVLLEPENPGVVKIGMTRGSAERRVRSLHSTGRARSLVLIWDEYVTDPELVEAALHERFGANRVTPQREFFQVAPKVAVQAVIEEAGAYRAEPYRTIGRAEILPQLRERFGDIIRPELRQVAVLVRHDGVLLETRERSAARDDLIVTRNLDFIYVDDDKPLFSELLSAEVNAVRLLELDELSLAMTTNLVSEEAGQRVDEEQSPYRNSLWDSLQEPESSTEG